MSQAINQIHGPILGSQMHCGQTIVAALAIDKVGPRPYHFRSSPTSGPTTRPESQKSKISTEIFNMFNHMAFASRI